MIEFKELRSGKDLAYFMRRQVKFSEWGGEHSIHQSSRHLFERNIVDNTFATVYDYDIKICACLWIALLLTFLKNVSSRK